MAVKKVHPWIVQNQTERKRDLPTYSCRKVAEGPAIDGVFEKQAWQGIESTGNFWFSDGSRQARYFTEAKLCWNDEKLYIAFNVTDHNICATYKNRKDPVFAEDCVEVFISPFVPFGPPYKYFEINVNPLNTLYDSIVINDYEQLGPEGLFINKSFKCEGMETAVAVRGKLNDPAVMDEGYSVEYAIPFSDFEKAGSSAPRPGTTWRLNMYRIDGMPQTDFYAWSPNYYKFPAFHIPTGFAYLKFVD